MATRTRRFLGAVVGVLLVGLPRAAAAQDRPIILSDEPGKWKPWTFTGFSSRDLARVGATANDARTFEARVTQLADLLRSSPVWISPVGVDALLSASGSLPILPKTTPPLYQPLSGVILMGSFEHLAADRERRERFVGGETSLVLVDVNLLPSGGASSISLGDDDGTFLKAPVKTGELSGFPVYGGDVLVITSSGRQPWAPVSRERYLKALVVKRRAEAANADRYIVAQQKLLDAFRTPEATAARQKKYADAVARVAAKGDAAATEHERRYWQRDEADALAALEKGASRDPKISHTAAVVAGLKVAEDQLAALSAIERADQAFFVASDDPLKTGLVAAGVSGGVPLVAQNLRFFDPALPRGVPQIIAVTRMADVEKGWKRGRPAPGTSDGSIDLWTTYEVLRTTDWTKAAALLGK